MERHAGVRHSQESLGRHARDLEGIGFLELQESLDLLNRFADRILSFTTVCRDPAFSREVEEVPSRVMNFRVQRIPVKTLDRSPAGRVGFTLASETSWENRAIPE